MYYYIKFNEDSLVKTIEDIFLMFFPYQQVRTWQPGETCHFEINYYLNKEISVEVISHFKKSITIKEVRDTIENESESQLRRLVRLAFYKTLLQIFDESPKPWGILTGVRPTKVIHRMLDQNWTFPELYDYLHREYYITYEKAQLLKEVTSYQRKLFDASKNKAGISIYISIPFCPTKCMYCSFPAYEASKFKSRISKYLEDLKRELVGFYDRIKGYDFEIDAIYIGGGTPTVLTSQQLEELFKSIEVFKTANIKEYTLEAGRPDTIDEDKLKLAKQYGVTRFSVNPQSMHQQTLDAIGRCHTVQEVIQSANMVHKFNFKLNMDLIFGLPGENVKMFEDTLDKILELEPHNITTHTLAIKSASKLRRSEITLPHKEEVAAMHHCATQKLKNNGYVPYYLYRQKRILADLENTGFTKPGDESWYNIMMMEERQTIIGFGVGAASKFIDPETFKVLGLYYNPKDPLIYGQRENLINDKVKLLLEGNLLQ